jgi:hypothetical protein
MEQFSADSARCWRRRKTRRSGACAPHDSDTSDSDTSSCAVDLAWTPGTLLRAFRRLMSATYKDVTPPRRARARLPAPRRWFGRGCVAAPSSGLRRRMAVSAGRPRARPRCRLRRCLQEGAPRCNRELRNLEPRAPSPELGVRVSRDVLGQLWLKPRATRPTRASCRRP